MKPTRILIVLITCFTIQTTFSQNFNWATCIGGSNNDFVDHIVVDDEGNTFTTGRCFGTVDFDPGPNQYNLGAASGLDIFIQKLDSLGNFVWAKQIVCPGDDFVSSIKLDAHGNVYISGQFSLSTDFDPGPATHTVYGNNRDAFLLKLKPNGDFGWVNVISGNNNGYDSGKGIAINPAGNLLLGGTFAGTADFNPGPGVYSMTSTSNSDFIAEYDTTGAFIRAVQLNSNFLYNYYNPAKINCDSDGNVYYVGTFMGTVDFDPGPGEAWLVNTDASNGQQYLLKLNNTFDFQWVKHCGATYPYDIEIEPSGTILLAGHFGATQDFDFGSGTFQLTSVGDSDIFICRLTASGDFVWAKRIGSSGYDYAYSLAIDNPGNIYMTGSYSGNVDFDPGLGISNLSSSLQDVYILKLDNAGSFNWVRKISSTGNDYGQAIQVSDSGEDLYISGTVMNSSSVDFDPGSGTYYHTPAGTYYDVFNLKLSTCLIPNQPATVSGNTTVCEGTSQTYTIPSVPGATSYNWLLPNGWTGTSISNSITVTAGTLSGNIQVRAINACGYSIPRTLTIVVNPLPVLSGAVSGSASLCEGSDEVYSIPTASNATSYSWTLPNGWTGASTSASISATAGSTNGTITVTANNSCGSSSAQTLSVIATPLPVIPGQISGSASLCDGSTEVYSIPAASGATSYSWVLPNGWTGASSSASISATAGSTNGTITVTANNSCGSSAPQTLAVTAGTVPVVSGIIDGSTSLCEGSTEVYSIPTVSYATYYSWTLPNGWTGSSSSTSISATAGSTNGTITVTANNSCGSSAPQTLAVTAGTVPVVSGIIDGSTSLCEGSTEVYSIPTASYATSYSWTLPNGWTGASSSTSISATAGSTNGTISVTANNSCGSSSAQTLSVIATPLPVIPGQISGSASLCEGSTEVYSIPTASYATSYSWTLPNGWTGASSSTSISATAGSTNGTITVTANNSCGSSSAQTLSVTLNASPVIASGTVTDPISCINSDGSIEVSGTGTGDLSWSGTSSGTNNGVTLPLVIPNLGQGTYTIDFTDANGCTSLDLSVTLSAPAGPTAPTISADGPTTFCEGGTVTLTASTGDTYLWSSGETTSSIDVDADGTFTVIITDVDGCTSPASLATTVNVDQMPSLTVTEANNIITATQTGATYQWINCGNGNQAISGATGVSFTPTANGLYAVIVSSGTCSDTSACTTISTIGLEEKELITIGLHPNPSFDLVTITSTGEMEQVEIFATTGELIRIEKQAVFDIRDLSRGIYLVKVTTNEGIGTIRLVKEL